MADLTQDVRSKLDDEAEWQDAAYTAARRIIRNRRHWAGMAEDLLAIVTAKIGAPRDGRFEVKAGEGDNGHAFQQTLFTTKGIQWIAGEWGQHLVFLQSVEGYAA